MRDSARVRGFFNSLLDQLYHDGLNRYQAVASNPVGCTDPLGLYSWDDWWEDTKQGAGMLWNGYQTASSFADGGGLLQSMAEEMIGEYAANLESDVEWALDWKADDSAHSRGSNKWVQRALFRGAFKHFNLEYWFGSMREDVSDGPAVAHRFPDSLRKLSPGVSLHQIATWYGRVGRSLGVEFRKAGMTLSDAANAVPLVGHKGPHDPEYNKWILRKAREINRRNTSMTSRNAALRRFLWDAGEKIRTGRIDPNDFHEP
ncbi:MAG: AHH domain-containing protein [Phycisphaerales bacterium]